jgi:DNA-binding NarL/FixJ family response regulator
MLDQKSGPNSRTTGIPAVVVQSPDPLTRDGTMAFMAASDRVEVLPADRVAEADVVVMITADVTGKTLSAMSEVKDATAGRARIVLVADRVSEPQLTLAVSHGMVSFLVRPCTSFSQIVAAAVESHRREPAPPPRRLSALLDRQQARQNGDSPAVPPTADLAPREVDVLRLLAEGMDVMEIATTLSYSERLIKSIIHTVVKRFGLRNRTQAVAHAIRAGIL